MVPKKSLILAGAALSLFGAASSAQSQSNKLFARYNKPLKSATLDLATGTITTGPSASNRNIQTCTKFNNNDLGGFVGVDTGNCFCEWFDAAGPKGGACGTDLMEEIIFAYCSSMLSAESGGPGGTLRLGFYEGYTIFGGAPTTQCAAFTLSGLPANTASSSFFGGFRCFFIRVTFDPMINCMNNDVPWGWSWRFVDVGADGILAGTWPFLSCVVSCSGAILQVDGNGMTDAIDEYCPPGFLLATFTFGTTSGSFTSMSMQKIYVDHVTPTIFTKESNPSNPDKISADPVVLGGKWRSTITSGFTRGAGVAQWYFGPSCLATPAPIPTVFSGAHWGTSKAGRMLICSLQSQIGLNQAHGAMTPGSTVALQVPEIPKDPDLIKAPFCIQGIVFGNIDGVPPPDARVTNAVTGVIGTIPKE
jgi:hypothetical protein